MSSGVDAISRRDSGPARALLPILLLVATYGYFHQGICSNQNAHFDLARALSERRSVIIDPYHHNTGDKALREGHYYSNKPPGLGILASPVVAVVHWTLPVWGEQVGSPRAEAVAMHLAMLVCVCLPTALAALALRWICLSLGSSATGATIAAAAFALGGPALVYASLFWSHMLTASLLTFAFAAAVGLSLEPPPKRKRWLAVGVGLAAGLAVLTEYHAAPVAVLLAGLGVWNARAGDESGISGLLSTVGFISAGAAPGAAALLAYQTAAFGSPFTLSYQFDASGWDVSAGFLGLGIPSVSVLGQLLFGAYRGILPLAPALALSPFGFWIWWRQDVRARPALLVAALIVSYYFLLNASYAHWHGGWSYGPRYLSPSLPFAGLGLAALWTWNGPRLLRPLIVGLIGVGFAFAFMAAATKAQVPNYYPGQEAACHAPLTQLIWPAFRAGRVGLYHFWDLPGPAPLRIYAPDSPWNVGHLLGLEGLDSLLPLVGFWIVMAAVWFGLGRRSVRAAEPSPDQSVRSSKS